MHVYLYMYTLTLPLLLTHSFTLLVPRHPCIYLRHVPTDVRMQHKRTTKHHANTTNQDDTTHNKTTPARKQYAAAAAAVAAQQHVISAQQHNTINNMSQHWSGSTAQQRNCTTTQPYTNAQLHFGKEGFRLDLGPRMEAASPPNQEEVV